MHNMLDSEFDLEAIAVQPWLRKSELTIEQQRSVQELLARKAGAKFGSNCYVALDAKVFTDRLIMGDRSWIASGAIVRGDVEIDADCSINPYAHIAGSVRIGRGCRIASLASIYGFNHGIQPNKFVKDQATTSKGVRLHKDIWIGANAVILDGVELGDHCIVAAGAVVTRSFPAYQVLAGNPARVIADRRNASDAAPSSESGRNGRQVRSLLFDIDPYDNLPRVFPEDLQGWGSEDPVFEEVLKNLRPKLIVEVGTWKGASAIHMATLCKKLALDAEVICIDTWLGNWQHWARAEGVGSRVDLRLMNGRPELYLQFLSNVLANGHRDIITPLPLTGIAGAKLFAHHSLNPDLVYVDGDHEYEAVILDLRAWLGLLSPSGLLIGDDYSWPGVRKAVEEIASEGVWEPQIMGNKFVFRRISAKENYAS